MKDIAIVAVDGTVDVMGLSCDIPPGYCAVEIEPYVGKKSYVFMNCRSLLMFVGLWDLKLSFINHSDIARFKKFLTQSDLELYDALHTGAHIKED